MKILGLTTMGGSAATIVVDGVVVSAIEEERLTRLKNDGGFPYRSIELCLEIANLDLSDIDVIAVYWQPWRIFSRTYKVIFGAFKSTKNVVDVFYRGINAFANIRKGSETSYPELRGSWLDLFKVKTLLSQKFGKFKAKVEYYDHHDCHAASVYFISNLQESICLSYDGGGESESTVIYHIKDGNFNRLKSIKWPNSLGHFYSAFTGFLGFRMLEGEYKMMGLSPYGNPIFKDIILNEILLKRGNGEYHLNVDILNYHSALEGNFSSHLKGIFGDPRKDSESFTEHHQNIASSVQAAYEDVLLHMLSWAKSQRPGVEALCISGGCGLNVSANGRVVMNDVFKKVFIPPAPHDAGCSIGAAFLSERSRDKNIALSMPTPYLGKAYTDEEITSAFRVLGLKTPERYCEADLISTVTSILIKNGVVAWFQGSSEFGPRALGNRSFLADPRSEEIREVINNKIKKRELFRPFAPSCKKEVMTDFFKMSQVSPYMNIVAEVKESKRSVIPAITHIDNTARVHTVDKEVSPLYWKLIDSFEKKTGVGVLLNTSFNIQEPIVENPTQAINCFLRSSADCLAIGPFICDSEWRENNKL